MKLSELYDEVKAPCLEDDNCEECYMFAWACYGDEHYNCSNIFADLCDLMMDEFIELLQTPYDA